MFRARRPGAKTSQPFKKLFAMFQISGRVAQAVVVLRWLPFGRIVILTSDLNSIPGAAEESCESRPTQPRWVTCRDSQSCVPSVQVAIGNLNCNFDPQCRRLLRALRFAIKGGTGAEVEVMPVQPRFANWIW